MNSKNTALIIGIICSVILAAVLTFGIGGGFFDNSAGNGGEECVKVHFVDVGQGDCEIIQTAGYNIIIDAGEITAKKTVIEYAKSLDIKRFDYVIATHPHSDHIGSLGGIIENFEIGTVIMPKVKDELVPTTNAYESLLRAISDKNLKIHKAVTGEEFVLDGAVLKILAPVGDYDDLNNYSVVCKLTCGERSFIFSGDAEKNAENDIVSLFSGKLGADVYKVGHHGSKTSSCSEFLNQINPVYAVISCGAGNDYGHPHRSLIKRLDGTKILRTDLLGTITFVTDGKKLEYYTQK